jgi:4-hydroxy-tetrahydrodipicolinate synthase
MANIALPLVTRMFNDPAAPEAMQAAIRLIDGPFVPTLKAVLAAQTGAAGWRRVRAPLREAGAAKGEQIAAALTDLSARKAA